MHSWYDIAADNKDMTKKGGCERADLHQKETVMKERNVKNYYTSKFTNSPDSFFFFCSSIGKFESWDAGCESIVSSNEMVDTHC